MGVAVTARHVVVSIGDRTAPQVMARLRRRRVQHDDAALDPSVEELREAVESLTERVGLLEDELDEARRDNIRLAELTDLVEQYLAQPNQSDPPAGPQA